MSAAPDTADTSFEALDFLTHLYDHHDGGWLTLFAVDRTTGEKVIRWRTVDEIPALSIDAANIAGRCCVWFGAATRTQQVSGRGTREECEAIPGLWLDIDVAGPNHTSDTLPPTMDDAELLLSTFPMPPTAVVSTGGGLQAWWKFAEPLPADEATTILARWGATWAEYGKRRGWHVDNVFDLARVMRLPGTQNRKNAPRPVYVVRADWTRVYGVDDIDQWLITPPAPPAPEMAKRATPYIGPERPGDAFNAATDGRQLLEATGWVWDHSDTDGHDHYRAPHHAAERGATGATVYKDDGHITLWSETFASQHGMKVRRPYDPFGYYTHAHHGGDFTASSDALAAKGYGTKAVQDLTWLRQYDQSAPVEQVDNDDEWPDPIPLQDTTGPLPAFPTHVFPTWINEQISQTSDNLQVNIDLPASLALGALSVAALGSVKVKYARQRWTQPTNLFVAVAMPPSAGKSPAKGDVFAPLEDYEQQLVARSALARNRADSERGILTKRRSTAIDRAAKGDQEARMELLDIDEELARLEHVPSGRLLLDDCTTEALGVALADAGGSIAVVAAEGGIFDRLAGSYSDGVANLDLYLEAWSGGRYVVDRIKREPINVPSANLCVVTTVQPTTLDAVGANAGFAGRGLTARFLLSMPPSNVGYRDRRKAAVGDDSIAARYAARLTLMAESAAASKPVILLEGPASDVFADWDQHLEDRLAPGCDLEPLAEWVGKLRANVIRIAALLHLAHGHRGDVIDEATMVDAIAVGTYFLEHMQAIADRWGVDEDVAKARQILTWITREGLTEVAARDIQRSNQRAYSSIEDIRPPVQILTERGWLRPLFEGPMVLGRRGVQSPRFAVHPSACGLSHVRNNHVGHVTMSLRGGFDPLPLLITTTTTPPDPHDMTDMTDMTPIGASEPVVYDAAHAPSQNVTVPDLDDLDLF